jgi:hypothetical protein
VAIWTNPEWIRHVRGLLRPSRAIAAVALPLVLCAVTYSVFARLHSGEGLHLTFFNLLVVSQFVALGLWCLYSCGQALVHERIFQTFDFWRTTRLTASELIWGMLCGAPLLGYVAIGATIPIGVISGIAAGYHPIRIVSVYMFLACLALFLSLVALLSSMLARKLQLGFGLAVVPLLVISLLPRLRSGPLPGLASINPVNVLAELLGDNRAVDAHDAVLFGFPISLAVAAGILYPTLGAWVFIMLLRNIKKERGDIQLLSRLQLMGFAVYFNVVLYAFLDARAQYPGTIMTLVLLLNVVILYVIGMIALTPAERLREWWRSRRGRPWAIFAEDGMSWPWVVSVAVVAILLYGLANVALLGDAGSGVEGTKRIAMSIVIVALFAVRDSLFLQWCQFHRFRQPLVAGGLYIGLYYLVVSTLPKPEQDHVYLTPFWSMANDQVEFAPFALSLLVQGIAILALVYAIRSRLSEKSTGPAAA